MTRALAASEFGSADDSQLAIDALIKSQNADGGWGWLADEASDPLATAQALYVLERSGRGPSDPSVRAIKYLLEQQQPNGSWKANGTKKNKGKRVQETTTYWATAWSVIALGETWQRLQAKPVQ